MALDLFNSRIKKEAQHDLERLVDEHQNESKRMTEEFVLLQKERDKLATALKNVEGAINLIKNKPESFEKDVQQLTLSLNRYDKLLNEAKAESANIERGAGAGLATGAAVGGAVAAFGGTALTAMAMSIGTASTGTAIAGLSGAAATNAALAWLGGGAVAAGGAGIAGGEALLALTGPIGWAIGGGVALTTGLWARGKNAKAAEDMLTNSKKVEAGIKAIKAIVTEVRDHEGLIMRTQLDLSSRTLAVSNWPENFNEFTNEQVLSAGSLVNNALSAEKILNAKLGDDGKFSN